MASTTHRGYTAAIASILTTELNSLSNGSVSAASSAVDNTSALDTETEQLIQQSLAELSEGRTTLVIAHRLATIKNADRIVVVTEHGISEQGAHAELITAGGVYSRLHHA